MDRESAIIQLRVDKDSPKKPTHFSTTYRLWYNNQIVVIHRKEGRT